MSHAERACVSPNGGVVRTRHNGLSILTDGHTGHCAVVALQCAIAHASKVPHPAKKEHKQDMLLLAIECIKRKHDIVEAPATRTAKQARISIGCRFSQISRVHWQAHQTNSIPDQ